MNFRFFFDFRTRKKIDFFFTVTKNQLTVQWSIRYDENGNFFIRRCRCRCRLIEFNLLFGVNDNDDEQTNKINFNVTNWLIVELVGWLKWIFFITIKQNTDDDVMMWWWCSSWCVDYIYSLIVCKWNFFFLHQHQKWIREKIKNFQSQENLVDFMNRSRIYFIFYYYYFHNQTKVKNFFLDDDDLVMTIVRTRMF